MVDTDFCVPPEKQERLATVYGLPDIGAPDMTLSKLAAAWESGFNERIDVSITCPASISDGFARGGFGLFSTAWDYLHFAQMLLNGGELDGVRILSPKTVELITTNHLGDLPMGFGRSGVGFGLGFAVSLDQGHIGEIGSPGEYSWGGAAGTRFWIDPEEELIGIFMVQSIPHRTRLAQTFRVLTYQAIVE